MEKEFELRTFRVKYSCDKCGVGNMVCSGAVLDSDPTKYPHECNRCGEKQTFPKKYPFIKYKRG